MSITIDCDTVLKSIWPPKTREPPILSNGRFLNIHLDTAGSGTVPLEVTAFAFHLVDETQAVMGTSHGLLYGVSLAENKIFLLANAAAQIGKSSPGPAAVRAVAFCGAGPAAFPHVAAVLDGSHVLFFDWRTAALVYRVRCGPHARPVTAIATGAGAAAPHSQLLVLVSADAISCWVPRASGSGVTVEEGSQSVALHAPYVCVATAAPTQAAHARASPASKQRPHSKNAAGRNARVSTGAVAEGRVEAHRFLSAHVHGTSVLTTETNGVVARWTLPPEALTVPPRRPAGSATTGGGLVLERCVRTLPFRVGCAASCPAFLALGSREMAAVALVDAETLEGLGVFELHPPSDGMAPGKLPAPVTRLSIVGNELVFCALADGRVVCVAASTHRGVFTMRPPTSGLAARFCAPRLWGFAASGPTYGVYYSTTDCVLFHLPTARAYDERCRVLTQAHGPGLAVASSTRADSSPSAGDVLTFTVRVVPFLSQRRERSESPAAAVASTAASSTGSRAALNAAQQQKRFPRLPLALDPVALGGVRPRATWIDVNTVEAASSSGLGAGAGSSPASAGGSGGGVPAADRRSLSVLSRALYSDALGDAACAYNMNELRSYLNRFGVFPSSYRPAIWRFILGLPSRRRTAPQFAALARRRLHGCVAAHMEPYPLPPGPTRAAMEQCLSVLAHHEPAFAVASFTPAFVFPLLHVFGIDDVQSVVEVLLLFFRNWGQEFFIAYPEPPPKLLLFLHRRLAHHDGELARHLDEIGCGAETWMWLPMLTFLTDTLTGPEWLQVMDHAFMMQPIWLYFYVLALLLSQRERILTECRCADDVAALLLHAPLSVQDQARRRRGSPQSFSPLRSSNDSSPTAPPSPVVADAIEAAYALYAQCPTKSSVMADYLTFSGLGVDYAYPSDYPVDEGVLRTRMAELHRQDTGRAEAAEAARRLEASTRAADEAALREEALLHEQRARIAAKYGASAETWQARVALERARQEREACVRELRLEALRARVASAEELERLGAYAAEVRAQSRHEVVDRLVEEHRWNLASSLTDAELAALERDAEARVEAGLRRLTGGHRGQSGAEHAPDSTGVDSGSDDGVSLPAHARSMGGPADVEREGSDGGVYTPRPAHPPGTPRRWAETGSGLPAVSAAVSATDDSPLAQGRERGRTVPRPPSSPERETRAHEEDVAVGAAMVDSADGAPAEGVGDTASGGDGAARGRCAVQQQQQEEEEEGSRVEESPVAPPRPRGIPPYVGTGPALPVGPDADEEDEDMAAYNRSDDDYPSPEHAPVDPLPPPPPPPPLSIPPPRPAPLPVHMAPFVPSAELLRALQGDRQHHHHPLRVDEDTGGGGGRSSSRRHREQFQALQLEVQRLRREARELDTAPVSTAAPPPWTVREQVRHQPVPPPTQQQQQQQQQQGPRRPLFDNLSDDPTLTHTTAATTGTGGASATRPSSSSAMSSSVMETAAGPGNGVSTTASSSYSAGERARRGARAPGGAEVSEDEVEIDPEQYRRAVAEQRVSHAGGRQVATAAPTSPSRSSWTPSSSAASAVQRPWRDAYYWRAPGESPQ